MTQTAVTCIACGADTTETLLERCDLPMDANDLHPELTAAWAASAAGDAPVALEA